MLTAQGTPNQKEMEAGVIQALEESHYRAGLFQIRYTSEPSDLTVLHQSSYGRAEILSHEASSDHDLAATIDTYIGFQRPGARDPLSKDPAYFCSVPPLEHQGAIVARWLSEQGVKRFRMVHDPYDDSQGALAKGIAAEAERLRLQAPGTASLEEILGEDPDAVVLAGDPRKNRLFPELRKKGYVGLLVLLDPHSESLLFPPDAIPEHTYILSPFLAGPLPHPYASATYRLTRHILALLEIADDLGAESLDQAEARLGIFSKRGLPISPVLSVYAIRNGHPVPEREVR